MAELQASSGHRMLGGWRDYFTPTWVLAIAGLLCLAAAIVLLVLTADASPTDPQSRRLFGLWRIRHVVPSLGVALAGVAILLALRSRQAVMALVAVVASTCATVLALEALGALGLVSWAELLQPRLEDFRLGSRAVPHLAHSGVTHQDTASAWGMKSEPVRFDYRTDRYGFRNDVDRPHADIVLLGDSMLVGALVAQERTVGPLLEKATGRSVMQMALIGLAPQEAHRLYWETKLEAKPKHVVQFIFEGNDLLDSKRFREGPQPGTRQDRSPLLGQVWRLLTEATDRQSGLHGLRACLIDGHPFTFGWARNSFDGHEAEASAITDALAEFGARMREAGIGYSVVFVPSKLRVLAGLCSFPPEGEIKDPAQHLGPLHRHMLDWGRASGIEVLDLTGPLTRAAEGGDIGWFWGDTHWNESGHAVAARALAGWAGLRRP